MGLVEIVDNALLSAAGKAVDVWGDYTGRSKYGLARVVNNAMPLPVMAKVSYSFLTDNYTQGAVEISGVALGLFLRHKQNARIRRLESLEKIEKESEVVSFVYNVLRPRRNIRILDVGFTGILALQASAFYFTFGTEVGSFAAALSLLHGSLTATDYIVSVDSGTPKKGKIVKAVEAVTARIPKFSVRKPAPQPG